MNERFMKMAIEDSKNANCVKGKVGAIIVLNGEILGKGNNSVPEGVHTMYNRYMFKKKI